jgi:hypothetical protein
MSWKQLYLIENEHYCLVECDAMKAGGNTPILQKNILLPSSGRQHVPVKY